MRRYNIPTAEYRNFRHYDEAKDYLSTVNHRVVIKVSGLAAGKGVVLPESQGEAHKELREIMVDKKFGDVGEEVVIEEFLSGDEISILTFVDGHDFKSLPPGQDHKRIFDGSRGPNTGGMGVYGPTDFVSRELMWQIDRDILAPTIQGLESDGHPFRGMLFTGIMVMPTGPEVLNINLADVCLSCIKGTLGDQDLRVQDGYACNAVVASAGHPGEYRQGHRVEITPCPADTNIFHAGTILRDGHFETAGGRVVSVSAVRRTLPEAVEAAYEGVRCIDFPGMQYRRDIASRLGSVQIDPDDSH
ncbi:phosphoribosylglycinamide synthetase [Dactylonectria macrodidyma]|uniref:phosphoribosylamine--glycine ligase n=1 Tax=Dactylonectria macrodidyma TaxID=307937 RepID=A0A9P9JH77_9HYPO|nr:phosphoribosylglycinamide synthetase [Dactylonectria macrodidyma]